jgi:hypothetical protein
MIWLAQRLPKIHKPTHLSPLIFADCPSFGTTRRRIFCHLFRHLDPSLFLESHPVSCLCSPLSQGSNKSKLLLVGPDCIWSFIRGRIAGRWRTLGYVVAIAHRCSSWVRIKPVPSCGREEVGNMTNLDSQNPQLPNGP